MEKTRLWTGFEIYYNDEICIAEINYEMINMGIARKKWSPADPTDTKVPEKLRPKVPVTVRNDGTGPIWLQIKPNGFLEVYSTQDWQYDKGIPLRATMVWRKQ